ncbi:mediator of RNA polymerase II transcription subunit 24-like isoform X2 [Patiria miniata]|uniref:Mediator of RNA polymerase II transcription subunit 24 n=1 Tax=Patiria miniata TaxID=46514 RepID=A0A914BRM0_PATMI|nr:mediator of RNA polymerase II transcription subunit 24-like isoform X2 [Patiria miniata]
MYRFLPLSYSYLHALKWCTSSHRSLRFMETIQQRSQSLKELLLKAWRERWSDVQWSTHMKRILPPGVSGDAYKLTDIILTQAFVGPNPNSLMLSYLKHIIVSQVVSHTAVLSTIIEYETVCITRPYCMRGLLEILNGCINRINCQGSMEECLTLCQSFLQVIHWLLHSITLMLDKMPDMRDLQVMASNLDIISEILRITCTSRVNKLLLFVAKLEDKATWTEIEETVSSIRTTLFAIQSQQSQEQPTRSKLTDEIQSGSSQLDQFLSAPRTTHASQGANKKDKGERTTESIRERLERSLQEVLRLAQLDSSPSPCSNSLELKTMSSCIGVMTFMEAALNVTGDLQPFVDQLLLVEQLQNLPRASVYLELCQASLLGLIDLPDTCEELKWLAFTFIKLPQILARMKQSPSPRDSTDSALHFISCFEQLLRFNVLIDQADTKHNCDCMQQLLQQCSKLGLITENQLRELLAARSATRRAPVQSRSSGHGSHESPQQLPNSTLVIRAEPTSTSILKKWDMDYSKNPDELLGVLGHMMSGKSFELIIAVLATTGKLKKFTAKLIKFNEQACKQTQAEVTKGSQVRAALFDISFLMLCHIAQLYGTEMVTSNGGDSFFETWVQQCIPDDNGAKPLGSFPAVEPSKGDVLLSQYHSGMDIKTMQARWNEVIDTMPYIMQEVLFAWENGATNVDQIQKLIDNVASKLCCLPICCVAWLCSHIAVLASTERNRALSLLQIICSHQASSQLGVPLQIYDNERNAMMQIIIRKMCSTSPVTNPMAKTSRDVPSLPPATPATQVLSSVFAEIMDKGCVDRRTLALVDQLITCGGVLWFCRGVVLEICSLHCKNDLTMAVEVAFALFQVDIEQLTLTLTRKVLPRILADPLNFEKLSNPRGHALARLTVWCIAATLTNHTSSRDSKCKESPFRLLRGRKRPRMDLDREDSSVLKDEARPSKIRRLLSVGDEDNATSTLTGSVNYSTGFLVAQTLQQLNEPFPRALVSLFQLFSSLMSSSMIGPRTEFVISFMTEIIHCSEHIASGVLQFAPITMMSQMLNTSSGQFLLDLALAIGRVDSVVARRLAAKALCHNKTGRF